MNFQQHGILQLHTTGFLNVIEEILSHGHSNGNISRPKASNLANQEMDNISEQAGAELCQAQFKQKYTFVGVTLKFLLVVCLAK